MNPEYIIDQLKKNSEVFSSILKTETKDQFLWKQSPEKWCLLEIVCHLYDEEREDFRARVKHSLENPDLPLKPIAPKEWVKERKYIEQDFLKVLNNFLEERENSIHWLGSLQNPEWYNFIAHPQLGKITAMEFLANWLAHDYLHIRQIIKFKFDYLRHVSGEGLTYAGEW